MKKSFIYTFFAFMFYFMKALIYSLITGSTQINELIALSVSCIITLLFTLTLFKEKGNLQYYGINIGKKPKSVSLNVVVFIIPLINLAYIINPVNLNFSVILLNGLYVGFMEEIIFRGFLYRAIEERSHEKMAIIISSIIFGLYHFVNIGSMPIQFVLLQVIYAAAIGVVFAIIFSVTGSLLLSMVVHALTDILAYYDQEIIPAIEYLGAFICVVCALYYWKLRKRIKKQ